MKIVNSLVSFMPNIDGPASCTRRLDAYIAISALRYGAPVWAQISGQKQYQSSVRVHRRLAIRVTSAYRTISYYAICVIASMMPVCLTLSEDKESFQNVRAQEITTHQARRAVQ